MADRLRPYHLAWLGAHPGRSQEWLLDKLADGFHIHHVDFNHQNDDPSNLVLIDGDDHLRALHKWQAGLIWISPVRLKDRPGKCPKAVARGKKGGKARSEVLSAGARQRIASHAARKRWRKDK